MKELNKSGAELKVQACVHIKIIITNTLTCNVETWLWSFKGVVYVF